MHVKYTASLFICLICSTLSFSFHNGISESFIAESESVLDPNGDLNLHWVVDYRLRRVAFSLQLSETAPTFKWFAIGFSERGEIAGSDLCLLWIDFKGNYHFEDTHVDNEGRLHKDEEQNCDHFMYNKDNGLLGFNRYFDTCDDDDYIIDEGTTHVVWAHGGDILFSSEGLLPGSVPSHDKGFIRVRLLSPPRLPTPRAKEVIITNHQLKVPDTDTTYWCKVHKLPEYVTKNMHHIVQFQSTIQKGNEGLVHHMEVFYCDADPNEEIPLYEGSCFSTERPNITKTCSKVKAAWAMGAPPFTYPEAAGLPLGGPNANKYVMLEVHYNNPELRDDWVDSSGIVLHVTPKLRKYNAAIMELGLEYIDKMAIPGEQSDFPLTGYCVPECTGVGLPSRGIIVFGSQLHTHLTGISVKTRHFRNGVELPILNRDEHYSTHFQEIRILRKPVHVKPGDLLITTCLYDTRGRQNATIGGHAITDEMCVNYMHYYPATDLEVCKSSVSTTSLEDYFKFEKRWDNMKISEQKSPRENYLSIHPWTPLRAQSLHKLYLSSPIAMQCNRSDGSRFQGNWDNVPLPSIRVELPSSPRYCPNKFHG